MTTMRASILLLLLLSLSIVAAVVKEINNDNNDSDSFTVRKTRATTGSLTTQQQHHTTPRTWRNKLQRFLQLPSSSNRESEILAVIQQEMGLLEPGSPQDQAASWIINEDPMQLDADDDTLLQRYIVTLFWFQTTNNGSDEWLSCNPPGPTEDDTCVYHEILRQPDNGLAYEDVPNQIRWLSSYSECDWVGVWCIVGQFIGIDLQGQDLQGTIPTDLARLEYFGFGIFSFNLLTGNIPAEWASQATHLFMVEVMNNLLTGSIPDSYFNEGVGLWELNPSHNLITGTIPTGIGYLTELKNLYIFETDMNGSLPTEMGQLTELEDLWMFDNQFTGVIPTQLGSCALLENVFLFQNELTGTLPSELGNLRRVEFLKLDSNENIRGTIPEEYYDMTALTRLDLYNLDLEGTISTRIGLLTNLISVRLRGNDLTGPIPTEIANLPEIVVVWLHFNELTGSVPNELCTVDGLVTGNGQLVSDCLPQDNPPNFCSCCSHCCNRDTQTCSLM